MKKQIEFIPSGVYPIGYSREQAIESVNSGWAGLIHEIFDKLDELKAPITILQVKEKWGGLRVYSSPINDEFDKFLIKIELKSFTICETCGAVGKLRGGGWYKTLCDEHADGRKPINPF